ncbi:hypothetical protein QAD02_015995 [Eretmocerus hayati]|uniref:Uncharacterized protein n=1 Tax=Eretmocerus hayati TaxID=131215 RepID=A0ACC2PAU7_9HYME|nr:hypothetical protein QAD02_015995 [Eretmocerus hayati]
MLYNKYVWLFFLGSTVYMLYYSDYYKTVEKYFVNQYDSIVTLIKVTSDQEIRTKTGEILFTQNALKKYTTLESGLYLSILGQVFDVSSGAKHYGPGETYHVFTGCDGSAAFITGDFTASGLTDDVSSLTNKQIQSLINWVEFYRKTYVYKGKLIGRYYNKDGSPTIERHKLEERIQIAMKRDSIEEERKTRFPPCNVEWDATSGTRVWCSKNSGGVTRNWIGVPRMLYDNPGLKNYRCACIRLESKEYKENLGMIRVYDGCDENSTICMIKSTAA